MHKGKERRRERMICLLCQYRCCKLSAVKVISFSNSNSNILPLQQQCNFRICTNRAKKNANKTHATKHVRFVELVLCSLLHNFLSFSFSCFFAFPFFFASFSLYFPPSFSLYLSLSPSLALHIVLL